MKDCGLTTFRNRYLREATGFEYGHEQGFFWCVEYKTHQPEQDGVQYTQRPSEFLDGLLGMMATITRHLHG